MKKFFSLLSFSSNTNDDKRSSGTSPAVRTARGNTMESSLRDREARPSRTPAPAYSQTPAFSQPPATDFSQPPVFSQTPDYLQAPAFSQAFSQAPAPAFSQTPSPAFTYYDNSRTRRTAPITPQPPSATFWEHGSNSPVPRFEPDDVLIAIMGMTGAGKSSFISKVTTADLKVGHGLSSCTKIVGVATMKIGGRRIHFIDTPGFDDTELKDGDILEVIALYLSNPQGPPVRITGIIYLHRITDIRVGGSSLNNIKLFRGLVGSRSMRNVLLVTNMWGQVSRRTGEKREKELLDTDDFWGSMTRAGAKCDRYNNTREDGLRLLKRLLQNAPIPLQIQEEIDRGIPISKTTAGKQINEQIEKLRAQYEDKLADLKIELKEARDERDREREEKIRQEQRRAEERLEAAQKAREKLYESQIGELQEQIYKLQNRSRCTVM